MVVYAHVPDAPFSQLFSIFRIPFFFMLSGYLYKPRIFKEEANRMFYCLIIPYLIYNSFLLVITPPNDVPQGIVNVFMGNQEQLPGNYRAMWFLVSIMIMRLVSSLFVKHLTYLPIVSFLIYLLFKQYGVVKENNDIFQLNTTLLCFQFFIFGYFLKKNPKINILTKLSPVSNYLIIGVGFVALLMIGYNFVGPVNMFRCDTGNNFFLFLVVSYMLSYLLIRLFQLVFSKESIVVQAISNGTLLILCVHQTVIIIIKVLEIKSGVSFHPLLMPFIVLILLYMPIKLCDRYVPILIGKRKK